MTHGYLKQSILNLLLLQFNYTVNAIYYFKIYLISHSSVNSCFII